MRAGYRRLRAGLLATAALAASLAFSNIKPLEYFSFANHNSAESTEEPRKHHDDLPEREPIKSFPVERQLRLNFNEPGEPYRSSLSLTPISAPSGSRQHPMTNGLSTYAAYWLGEKLRTVNHELNGHGRVYSESAVPYDVAVNLFGYNLSTSPTLKAEKDGDGLTQSRRNLPERLKDPAKIGGVWGSKNLYRTLHDYTVREGVKGDSFGGRLSHWTAFWTGTDFMNYYRIDKQDAQWSRERGGDMRTLIDRGYGTDLKRAAIANLIGDGPDLLWHAAQGLGFDMKRPRIWEFTIPGTNSIVEVKPTAYISPFDKVVAPAVEARIRF